MSQYKALNQINNIVSKLIEESKEMERKLFIIENSKKTVHEEGVKDLALVDVAGFILAKEVADIYMGYDFKGKFKYTEAGISHTQEQVFDYQFDEYFIKNSLYKTLPYEETKKMVFPHYKPFYDKMVEKEKMTYVRKHKEE